MSHLTWSPVYKVIEERIASGDDIILMIVPFIKLDALKRLNCVQANKLRLKVICRWQPDDLLSGASDIDVFPYLKENGCELFLNWDVHLKLYVFWSNIAFNTSGNLTLRGLGYGDHSNIEVGNMVAITMEDWARIYRIVETSRLLDDALYEQFKTFVEQQNTELPRIPPPNLIGPPKIYTMASLPATETPRQLASFYSDPEDPKNTPENLRRGMHDLILFDLPANLSPLEFDARLGEAFRQTPFVQAFVGYLKERRSLNFGAVSAWIHTKCEDVPLPYRSEIKDSIRILFDWLEHYFPEIRWDVPGAYSQVIHWNK